MAGSSKLRLLAGKRSQAILGIELLARNHTPKYETILLIQTFPASPSEVVLFPVSLCVTHQGGLALLCNFLNLPLPPRAVGKLEIVNFDLRFSGFGMVPKHQRGCEVLPGTDGNP